MAEITASILGITAFGAQSLKTTIELKELWSSLKDAPQDIRRLCDEACHVQKLLVALRTQRDQYASFVAPCEQWEDCHDRCESAAKAIEEFTRTLKSKLAQNHKLGAIKVLMKRQHIEQMRRDLECAKSDVLLAQAAFSSAVQFQQLAQSRMIQNSVERMLLHPQLQSTNLPQTNDIGLSIVKQLSNEPSSAIRRASHRVSLHEQQKLFTFQSLWLRKRLSFDVHLTSRSWRFGIVIGNIIKLSPALGDCFKNDDLLKLQVLLQAREVSIHDYLDWKPHHESLLEISWFFQAEKISRYLLDFEAQASDTLLLRFWTWIGTLPSCFPSYFPSCPGCVEDDGEQICLKIERMIDPLAEMGLSMDNTSFEGLMRHSWWFRIFPPVINVPCIFRILYKRSGNPLDQCSDDERLRIALEIAQDSESFWLWYGKSDLAPAHAANPTLIAKLFTFVSNEVCVSDAFGFAQLELDWSDLLSKLIHLGAAEASFKLGNCMFETLFKSWGWFDGFYNQNGPGYHSPRFRTWLELLERNGQDMIAYFQMLNELLRRQEGMADPKYFHHHAERHPDSHPPRLLRITYESSTRRHTLRMVDWFFDEWAAEFWALVENATERNPETEIPGAWPEERQSRAPIFKSLATSRRKRRKFLRYMGCKTNDEAVEVLGPAWNSREIVYSSFCWPQLCQLDDLKNQYCYDQADALRWSRKFRATNGFW